MSISHFPRDIARVSEAGSEARPLVLKPMFFLLHSYRIGEMRHGNPKSPATGFWSISAKTDIQGCEPEAPKTEESF